MSFSRRKRQAEKAGAVDVYQYDRVPDRLRVQATQIIVDGIGSYDFHGVAATKKVYQSIVKELRKEVGVHQLVPHAPHEGYEFVGWLSSAKAVDDWIDAVELSLSVINGYVRDNWYHFRHAAGQMPDRTIDEMNARFQEAEFGYEFVSGEMVRIDSQLLHKEAVIPVLGLLQDPCFGAAEQEYRAAHQAYRNGELEDCIVDCGKAFESVLKVIAHKRGWPVQANDPASKLIAAAANANFLPSYSTTQLNHLKGLLESSTPTVRNKMGGHGAGPVARVVPPHLAAFQLHQTAAVILFLVEQDAKLP